MTQLGMASALFGGMDKAENENEKVKNENPPAFLNWTISPLHAAANRAARMRQEMENNSSSNSVPPSLAHPAEDLKP
jgi:hypothetical protein